MVFLLYNNKISAETTAINNLLFYCYYIFLISSEFNSTYITSALLNLQLVKKSLTTCDQALLIFLQFLDCKKKTSNWIAS